MNLNKQRTVNNWDFFPIGIKIKRIYKHFPQIKFSYHFFWDNIHLFGQYKLNWKKYCPESGTPTKTRECKERGGECGGPCRVSAANERGTETISLSLPSTPKWRVVWHLKCNNFFMRAFIPNEWICPFKYPDDAFYKF